MNVLTSTAIRTETGSRFARARRHSAELTARASEWHSLAARLEQRAAVWSDECSAWAELRDHRAGSSNLREQWVAEHLLTLAANEAP